MSSLALGYTRFTTQSKRHWACPPPTRSISGLAKARVPSWLKVTHTFLGRGCVSSHCDSCLRPVVSSGLQCPGCSRSRHRRPRRIWRRRTRVDWHPVGADLPYIGFEYGLYWRIVQRLLELHPARRGRGSPGEHTGQNQPRGARRRSRRQAADEVKSALSRGPVVDPIKHPSEQWANSDC